MDLNRIQNSAGKEYRTTVLFGKHVESYVSMVAVKYQLHRTNKDVSRLIKMHLDDGIEALYGEVSEAKGAEPFDLLVQGIDTGLIPFKH